MKIKGEVELNMQNTQNDKKRRLQMPLKVLVDRESMQELLDFTGAKSDADFIYGGLELVNMLVLRFKKSSTIILDITEFKECFKIKSKKAVTNGGNS